MTGAEMYDISWLNAAHYENAASQIMGVWLIF